MVWSVTITKVNRRHTARSARLRGVSAPNVLMTCFRQQPTQFWWCRCCKTARSVPLSVWIQYTAHLQWAFGVQPGAASCQPSTGSAPGHFPGGLYEGVNFAPFVTSFSTRRTASWQLYGRHALCVVMRRDYMGPNLLNQVHVSAAPLTPLARDVLSLREGQTDTLTPLRRKAVIIADRGCV